MIILATKIDIIRAKELENRGKNNTLMESNAYAKKINYANKCIDKMLKKQTLNMTIFMLLAISNINFF